MKKYLVAFSALLSFLISSPALATCGVDSYPTSAEISDNKNFSVYLEEAYQGSSRLYSHGAIDDSNGNQKLNVFYSARNAWNSVYLQYTKVLDAFKAQIDLTLNSPIANFQINCDLTSTKGQEFATVNYSLIQQTTLTNKAISNLLQRTPVTNDPLSSEQYYLKLSGIDGAGQSDVQPNAPVIVAVIDDGIYINHADLRDNIWINVRETIGNGVDDDGNGYVDDIYGYDFLGETGEMTVRGSHGTHVAGIIGAVTNNATGIQGIVKNIKLMPLIVCDSRIGCPTDVIISAIHYAVDNGASIINISLGTNGTTAYTTAYNDAIRYAFDHGVLIVAAAGNGDLEGGSGQDLNLIPQSPVCNDNNQNMVLGVAAINSSAYRIEWSNYGTNCVDIYAPGVNIFSSSVPAYDAGRLYGAEDGTSFSTPIVTGVAALIKQKYPSINPREINELIRKTAWTSILDAKNALNTTYDKYPVAVSPSTEKLPIAPTSDTTTPTNDFVTEQLGKQTAVDTISINRLKGYILLQVQTLGAAWYLNPISLKRYYLKDGPTAYEMLRAFGLGVSENDYAKIAVVNSSSRARLKGRIILRVQAHGEAYYISPKDSSITYLKDGEAAYQAMRNLSLGISDVDLAKIPIERFVPHM